MLSYEEKKSKERAQHRAQELRAYYSGIGKTAHIMYLDREWLRLNAAESTWEGFKEYDEAPDITGRYLAVVGFVAPKGIYWRNLDFKCIRLLALKNGLWLWIGEP